MRTIIAMSAIESQPSGSVPEWDVGDRLAKARKFAKLSREDLAEFIGVSVRAVGGYETGERRPRLSVLRLWAQRTGVSPDWLRGSDHQPGRPGGERQAGFAQLGVVAAVAAAGVALSGIVHPVAAQALLDITYIDGPRNNTGVTTLPSSNIKDGDRGAGEPHLLARAA